jgi:hypothetical protein
MRDDNTEPRDNQQIADDNQQSGDSIVGGQTSGDARQPTGIGRDQSMPNQASNKEPAEGSRENTAGSSDGEENITNRGTEEEFDEEDDDADDEDEDEGFA